MRVICYSIVASRSPAATGKGEWAGKWEGRAPRSSTPFKGASTLPSVVHGKVKPHGILWGTDEGRVGPRQRTVNQASRCAQGFGPKGLALPGGKRSMRSAIRPHSVTTQHNAEVVFSLSAQSQIDADPPSLFSSLSTPSLHPRLHMHTRTT